MIEQAVHVQNITKQYGNLYALKEINLSLEQNKIYGLLGRNGAGKTTLMHIVTAQWFPTSGTVKIFGQSPYENNDVLRNICFIKESQKYMKSMKIRDLLDFVRSIYAHWDSALANRLLADFQLPENRRIRQLSRGMLSSLGIVIGMASRAPITIFDEPYLGLDAASRSVFYDRLLEDYNEYPRTIILSTHLIDEVSRMLEHVIVIDEGKVLLDEDSERLREMAYTVTGRNDRLESFVAQREVINRETFGSLTRATILGELDHNVRRLAEQNGLDIESVSMQQLFVYLTEKKSRVQNGADEV